MDETRKSFLVTVTHEGNVTWKYPKVLKTTCPLEMAKFHMDSQECLLTLASWSYAAREIELHALNYTADSGES